ncbi:FecR family protein [Sphingobacterium spiritivorum]|uniref:FecR family protein n=1 Tax=Sphingobacterium spiritivorum TaxID=258 RepID=UPI003DA4E426
MGKQTDRQLLVEKYIKGQCTPEEIERIHTWYDQMEDHALPSEQEIDRASEEVTAKALRQVAKLQQRKTIKRILWQAGTAAAIFLLVFNFWPAKDQPQASSTPFAHVADVQETMTATSEKIQLTLPDGSSIILNAASTIRYPRNFSPENREIQLEGQAFFDVVSDPDRPFIVYTKDLTVKVLGTSFDVKAYDSDEQAVIRVATGKVAVSKNGATKKELALLHPGEQFDYDKEQRLTKTTPIAVKKISEWQQNILHFEFVPLAAICRELERTYGMSIVIENNDMLHERYYLNVQGETLDNILLLLSKSGKGFSYEHTAGKIIIK